MATDSILGGLATQLTAQAQVDALNLIYARLATAPATSALQTTGNASLSSIDTKLSSQATAALQTTGNASLSSVDTKLSSQATAARQDTGNTSLASIDTKFPAQVAGTIPVSLPSATVTAITPVSRASLVSTVNSTSANLAASATFTGTSEDVKDYAVVQITVFASHASATDGLSLQQSIDGTNWDITDTFTVPATTGKTYSVQIAARYYRLVYTNGATLTTSLRISSIYHYVASRSASQRPGDARSNENDFDETAAFLMGYDGTSAWNRLRSTVANGLAVDVTRLPALVAGAATVGSIASITTGVVPGVAATSLGKAEDAAHTTGDVGISVLGVRNDNAATDMTSANGDYGTPAVDIKGAQFIRNRPAVTPTLANVTSSATTGTILAANAARRFASIQNDSTADLYLKFGATASLTSYTVKVPTNAYYEVPEVYVGVIDGIWSAANGSARVTELV